MTDARATCPDPSIVDFVRELPFHDIPPDVVEHALWCLLDLAEVAAAGSRTPMSRIARGYAVDECAAGARTARLLFDGREVLHRRGLRERRHPGQLRRT